MGVRAVAALWRRPDRDGDVYLGASVKDALLVVCVVAAAALVARLWRPAFAPVLVGTLLGIAYAIEYGAVHGGHWSYGAGMPRIPGEVGLTPFLQLAVTGVLAVAWCTRVRMASSAW